MREISVYEDSSIETMLKYLIQEIDKTNNPAQIGAPCPRHEVGDSCPLDCGWNCGDNPCLIVESEQNDTII